MTTNRGLMTAVAVPLLLLGACARPGVAGEAGSPGSAAPVTESTTTTPTIALRVEYRGGFVPAETIPSRIPLFTVYTDGRAITEGPVTLIYPGPALPNLQEIKLSAAQVRELTDAAVAAGVRSGSDFGTPGVADIPSTRISVVTAGGEQSVEVMALSEARPDDASLSPAQQAARKKLSEFVKSLHDLFADAASPAAQPYQAEKVAVLASPYQDTGDGAGGDPVTWPAAELPGAFLNQDLRINCLTVEGAAKDKVLALAKQASERTPWESAGKKWQIRFRPLLPDEKQCADLRRQA
ncbi:hypothetical protein Aph02nite_05720 [Actinoplanes philippinensis]|uniref:Lipoprotein n=1 Tax=Actinoplanes philippinensis TaxID=35752 RepID=A0A1I2CXA8_9ACTN|nr:hypothetical protein [Actinoplanes philippinensis]GIE74622.1 hypothetical protein Aph02nite_05720 [Actinoplanes philippinensis]SFE72852.1 hypothetical protein SAMN05421541_103260 [Actinoplanes philippinensis]